MYRLILYGYLNNAKHVYASRFIEIFISKDLINLLIFLIIVKWYAIKYNTDNYYVKRLKNSMKSYIAWLNHRFWNIE